MATIATPVTVLNTSIEDAVSVERENGDSAEFTVQHYGTTRQLSIAILDAETEEPRDEPMEFSLVEANQLRALLNSPAVATLLDAAE